jgi:hypothetical protein
MIKETVMGLLSKALAVGFGYALAQPELRKKLVELVQHPQVKQRRDQVQDLATQGLQAAKGKLSRPSAVDTPGLDEQVPTPPYAGVPTLSPPLHASDRAALSEGVLPPAEDVGARTTLDES